MTSDVEFRQTFASFEPTFRVYDAGGYFKPFLGKKGASYRPSNTGIPFKNITQ